MTYVHWSLPLIGRMDGRIIPLDRRMNVDSPSQSKHVKVFELFTSTEGHSHFEVIGRRNPFYYYYFNIDTTRDRMLD